jgi:hypothetical protein
MRMFEGEFDLPATTSWLFWTGGGGPERKPAKISSGRGPPLNSLKRLQVE